MQEPSKMEMIYSKSIDNSIDSPSDVKLSDLIANIAENYNKYHQIEQQLQSLQQWIIEQERIYNVSK